MQKHKRIEEGSLEYQLLECCRSGSLGEVRALLDAGAAPDAELPCIADREEMLGGYSIVHIAAENPDIRIIKLLVERGADVDVKDVYDNTPLYYAAEKKTHLKWSGIWFLSAMTRSGKISTETTS